MGQVNTPTSIIDTLNRMQREIAAVRKRVGLGNATISAGDLTIQDGGTFRLRHPNGTVIAEIGNLGQLAGQTVWGARFMRGSSGTELFFAYSTEAGVEFGGLRDKANLIIVSDDGASGHGLATPWLNSGMWPSFNAETAPMIPGTTSASFVALWEARVPLTHPKLRLYALVQANDGSSSGEGRWTIDGTVIGTTAAAAAGGSAILDEVVDVPGWGSTHTYLSEAHVSLEVRRTAGTGRICGVPYALHGQQS